MNTPDPAAVAAKDIRDSLPSSVLLTVDFESKIRAAYAPTLSALREENTELRRRLDEPSGALRWEEDASGDIKLIIK